MKFLVADDEKQAREIIIYFLNQQFNNPVILESADGVSTLDVIKEESPEILFLDVQMPELSGVEVLEHKQGLLPAVVFTTAFDEYALDAFEFEAVDYLLKPFEQQRFNKALNKALDFVERVKTIQYSSNLTIKQGSKMTIIPVNDAIHFQAKGKYVEVVTEKKRFLLNQPLYELELSLDPKRFIRVHKSTIINTGAVYQVNSLPSGDY